MKTTKEMIEVMQAFERGEQIEILMDGKWKDTLDPLWEWVHFDYRVKPKKKHVPFKTAEEFLAAQREHGIHVFLGGSKYVAYVNANAVVRLYQYNNISTPVISELEYMLEKCTFEDGTPCGKEVEG